MEEDRKRYVMKDWPGCVYTITPEYLEMLRELELSPRQGLLFFESFPAIFID